VPQPIESTPRRRFVKLAIAAPVAYSVMGMQGSVWAQSNATPLRLVAGFPPGGAVDAIPRLVADQLRAKYPGVIVENRVGAGSRIALEHVARSPKDGTVLIFAPDFALTIFPHTFKKLPYDALKDFEPVAIAATTVAAFVVGPLVPESVRTLSDYVRWVESNPKGGVYGTGGTASSMDFVGQLFGRSARLQLTHVPYRGGGPAIQDLVAAQIPAAITGVLEPLQFAQAGRLRVLATSGTTRSRVYPGVPTFVEAGHKDVVVQGWFGFLAPSGTPDSILRRLAADIGEALAVPLVSKAILEFGLDPVVATPAEIVARVSAEHSRWGAIVKSLDFKPEE